MIASNVAYSTVRAKGLSAPYTNFAASRLAMPDGSSFRREMLVAGCYVWPHTSLYDATPPADDTTRLLAVDLSANAFLPQMVRTIISSLPSQLWPYRT